MGCGVSTLRLGQTWRDKGEADVAIDISTDEPQQGLNLMTRRGVCTGFMRIERLNGPMVLDPATGVVAASVLQGKIVLPDGSKLADLATLVPAKKAVDLEAEGCLLAIAMMQEA